MQYFFLLLFISTCDLWDLVLLWTLLYIKSHYGIINFSNFEGHGSPCIIVESLTFLMNLTILSINIALDIPWYMHTFNNPPPRINVIRLCGMFVILMLWASMSWSASLRACPNIIWLWHSSCSVQTTTCSYMYFYSKCPPATQPVHPCVNTKRTKILFFMTLFCMLFMFHLISQTPGWTPTGSFNMHISCRDRWQPKACRGETSMHESSLQVRHIQKFQHDCLNIVPNAPIVAFSIADNWTQDWGQDRVTECIHKL